MEIDLERCKELDAKHDYKYDARRSKWQGGFHANCAKKFQAGNEIKSICRATGSKRFYVKSALINLGFLDVKALSKRVPWKEDEIEKVRCLLKEEKTFYEISKTMGRSVHSVSSIIKRIKNGSIDKSGIIIERPCPKLKTCSCGVQIISFNDQCNWCRGKNEAN